MSGRISDTLNANINNEPDRIYYNLVESYISSTREILNGFMTFERGLVRILNNRIIFRNLPPTSSLSAFSAPEPSAAPLVPPAPPAPVPPAPVSPAPAPPASPAPSISLLSQPITATFVRYRLPLPSLESRATRGVSTPNNNLSVSLSSSPPHSPPPPPPPQTQSISPILPTSSRINRSYDWLDFIETTNNNDATNLNYFQRVAQRPRPLRPLPPMQEQRPLLQRAEPFFFHQPQQPQRQSEGHPNYVSYDTIQNATKLIPFCTISNPQNEICPISQIHFEDIDCIMQINHCKHNFNPYSLFRWLDSNSTCPMCRYNLNLYSNDDNDNDNNHNHYRHHDSEMLESESESEFD